MGNNTGYDLEGKRFGRLTVLGDTGKRHSKSGKIWLCLCACGSEKEIYTKHLIHGNTKSCGCLRSKDGNDDNKEIIIPDGLKEIPSVLVENGLFRVFKNGQIFRNSRGKAVECPFNDVNGYKAVSAMKDGKQVAYYVHKLLAQAFIPNPENKDRVRFKDGDTSNLSFENLEYITQSELMNDLYKNGNIDIDERYKRCKKCGGNTSRKDLVCSCCHQKEQAEQNRLEVKQKRIQSVAEIDLKYLTVKQSEVITLIDEGLRPSEIAERLGVSRQAIDTMIKNSIKRYERLKNTEVKIPRINGIGGNIVPMTIKYNGRIYRLDESEECDNEVVK